MSTGKDTPVTSLLETCKLACDDVTELIEAVYEQLGKEPGAAVRKEDMSFFSLADGVVQVPCISPHARHQPHACAHNLPGDNPKTNDAESHRVDNCNGC